MGSSGASEMRPGGASAKCCWLDHLILPGAGALMGIMGAGGRQPLRGGYIAPLCMMLRSSVGPKPWERM